MTNNENYILNDPSASTVFGSKENDYIVGSSSSDIIFGGKGDDYLKGRSGNDFLYGEDGNDYLYGGAGDDTLVGGTGFDTFYGGNGNDTYVISSSNFYLFDSDGNDTAIINTNFIKIPSTIENVTFSPGIKALPYWIDVLLADDAARFSSLLGEQKQYYFGYSDLIPYYQNNDPEDSHSWSSFNNAQKVFSRSVISYIDSLLGITFQETENHNQVNTISFANNTQENSAGYTYYPSLSYLGSDVFLNKELDGNITPREGENATNTFLHEIGHALGLKHPFSHQNALGNIGSGPYLSDLEDNTQWSKMSYTKHSSDDYLLQFSALDIATLHYLYGPNTSSRSGNDTYIFENDATNFIWDGAGIDLIDASESSDSVTISLEVGEWGYTGQHKADLITSNGQITINFGTQIENLFGSSFSDTLFGNEIGNLLKGREGNDYIYGYAGNDLISGGTGKDTLTGGEGVDTFLFQSESGLGDIITDFTMGEGGDELKISPLLITLGYTGSNPLSDGWLQLEQSDTDLNINLDRNGGGDSFHDTVVTLNNVSMKDFMSSNLSSDITDLDFAPSSIMLSAHVVEENNIGASIGIVNVTDIDDTSHTLMLSGVDAELFEIVSNQLKLKSGVIADYENQSSYSITITATDSGGLTKNQPFNIVVTNIAEIPTNITLDNSTIAENTPGSHVANIAGIAPDGDDLTYTITGGENASMFNIVNSMLHLASEVSADYETKNQLLVELTATNSTGLSYSEEFTISVIDTEEILLGTQGNDQFAGFSGANIINAGTGIDQVNYSLSNNNVSFSLNSDTQLVIQSPTTQSEVLNSVERIQFTDKVYALDVHGNAGAAAKAIIVTFGADSIHTIMSAALPFIDNGTSLESLCDLVVDIKLIDQLTGSSTNESFVGHVFNNVVGRPPNLLESELFTNYLDNGTYTKSSLLAIAANITLTEDLVIENSVDLVGFPGTADGEILAIQYDLGLG